MSTNQVDDDPELLELMLTDGNAAPPLYRVTNYWEFLDRKLLPELRRMGLRDFRRRPQSALASFDATDRLPLPPHLNLFACRLLNNRLTVRIDGYERLLERLSLAISRLLPLADSGYISVTGLGRIALDRAVDYGARMGARPLADVGDSLLGNPEWVVERGERAYTITFLKKYLNYAYCCRFLDFDAIATVVELGPGSGRQVEVLKKLHPQLTLYLFDIAPQLYVCEQYLKKVFGDKVVDYRRTRDLAALPKPDGRIYLFLNTKFPLLDGGKVDLFWNTASFQEMEPVVVANYLSFVNRAADTAFIMACMGGKHVARAPGQPGVLRATTFDDFATGLKDLECVDRSFSVRPFGDEAIESPLNYENSFWRRRKR